MRRPDPDLARELALLIVLSFLWGGSFTLIKVAVDTIPPATIVAVRVLVAAMILLVVARLRGLQIPKLDRIWGAFFLQGLLQSALPFTLIGWGEKHIDSGLAGLLNSTPPLFVFLLTFQTMRHDAEIVSKFIGVAGGLAGVVLILGVQALEGLGDEVLAQLAITGASLSYALAAIYGHRLSNQPAIVTAGCSMAMASLVMVPLSAYFDRPWNLAPSWESAWALIALAIFSTALAMIIYFRLLRTLGSLGTSSGSYLRAGFSVLLGVWVLDEPVGWTLVSGLILILAGVAIVNRRRATKT
jgi:drug/metabolite transporter (DMT)-like permease